PSTASRRRSLYRLLQGGGWIMAFASLVQSGYTHESAIRSLAEHAKPWLRARLEGILILMGGGLNVGSAMRGTGYGFPDEGVIDALEDYAGLNNFDRALMRVAERWIASGLASVDRIMIVLQTVFAVAIFAVFTWLMLAINGIQNAVGMSLH
ncbi:type II secretion system protein, partial [mine drainage metagenome]